MHFCKKEVIITMVYFVLCIYSSSVDMAKDVAQYCSHCIRCQTANAQPYKSAPLGSIIASQPWEMVAVDIVKVPPSLQGNQYILVA